MNNAFPFHLWKKVKLQPSLKKELDVLPTLQENHSHLEWLMTEYFEKSQFLINPLHSTCTPGSPTMCQAQC